jgi:sirohydrochlorin ferrochelatase
MEKTGILLLGHGSSLPHNKKLVEETTIKYGENTVELFYARPLGADPVIARFAGKRAKEALEVE